MHYLARCSLSELNTLWEWGDLSISESNLRPPLIWYVESHESDQSTRKTEGSLKARTHRDEYRRTLFASVFQRVCCVHTQAIFADDEPSEHANSFPDIRWRLM